VQNDQKTRGGVLNVIATAVAIASFTSGSFAADVAFYPFTDGTAGGDAIGATIQNAVNPETLSGTATLSSGSDATATFLDDVPGRYLYTNATWSADAIYRTAAYQSIQTTWITNKPASIVSGTTISFSGLGAQLADLDAWTVEFFFKMDEFLESPYKRNVLFGDDEKIGVCLEHKAGHNSVRPFAEDYNIRSASVTLPSAILPGMWHHLAMKYEGGSVRKVTAILDYKYSGSLTCTNETPFVAAAFLLGNGCSTTRFAALRVTDRLLTAGELMRASDIPPQRDLLDTRFHWSFESEVPGDSLGTVVNDVPWRSPLESSNAKQYAYAVDGQKFLATGDGIVTPLVYTYKTKTELGTLTMDGYASNITDSTRAQLVFPDGSVRANTNCAFLAVGPKDVNTELFGLGASFTMTGTELLTAGDFTAETYWRPDIDGWNAILGDTEVGSTKRYRSAIFGIRGGFQSNVQGRFNTEFAWTLAFDMNATNFSYRVVTAYYDVDGGTNVFKSTSFERKMNKTYLQKCNDGRLHHYAVVYRVADAENGNKPTVRVYIDHAEAETFTMSAPMVDFPTFYQNVAFSVGTGMNAHPMQGWYDEIRYTARALAPSEFLRLRRSPRGLVIMFH